MGVCIFSFMVKRKVVSTGTEPVLHITILIQDQILAQSIKL